MALWLIQFNKEYSVVGVFFSLKEDNGFQRSHVPYCTLRSKGICKLLSDRSASIYERSISVMNSKSNFSTSKLPNPL